MSKSWVLDNRKLGEVDIYVTCILFVALKQFIYFGNEVGLFVLFIKIFCI